MDFMSIGSIGSFAKTWKLQTQLKIKKESGNLLKKETKASAMAAAGGDPQLASIIERLDEMKENKDSDMERIQLKMQSGKDLSPDELEYLKAKNPAAYQKAKELQMERESYKRELKKCRTKEDVERLNTARLGASLTRLGAIANNPAIPKAKKLALCMQENARVNAMMDEHMKFVESGKLKRLPTEEERDEAIRERQEEISGKPETDREETGEPERPQEKSGEPQRPEEKPEIGGSGSAPERGEADPGPESAKKRPEKEAPKPQNADGKQHYDRASAAYREVMTGRDGPEHPRGKRYRKTRA